MSSDDVQTIKSELDELREERRINQHARLTSLEVWRGSVDAELKNIHQTGKQIKEWIGEIDRKNDERLNSLERTIYRTGGGLAFGAFLLAVIPHFVNISAM